MTQRIHSHPLGKIDHLIEKIGIGIVSTVESHYRKYCEQPNEKNAKSYLTWRFRLHKRLKNDVELLESVNEARNLGLNDERPGKTFWDLDFN